MMNCNAELLKSSYAKMDCDNGPMRVSLRLSVSDVPYCCRRYSPNESSRSPLINQEEGGSTDLKALLGIHENAASLVSPAQASGSRALP